MEEYMSKTQANYGSGIARPKIDDKDHFELKGQFLKELRDYTLHRQILDSKGSIPTKTAADAKVAIQEMAGYSQKWHNGASKTRRASIIFMPFLSYLNLGLGELAHTKLTVELANRTVKHPKRIAENVLVGIVVENMDGYRDQDMREVIFGEPFCKASCVEARRFDGIITIHNGNDNVTYQMARSHPMFKHLSNAQCNKIRPLLKVSVHDKLNRISHPYQKLKSFYKGVLNLGPKYIRDVKMEEWLTRGHISVHEME
ncbi:hypothetical protein Tco_0855343 [Tanacetum coccineum]